MTRPALSKFLLALLLLIAARAGAAITNSVNFDAGALTDSFSVNIDASPSPYSLAANGLAGTQGVDIGTSGDATLVYTGKAYDLSAITSLDLSCFFKKQATSANPAAITLALVGASNTRLTGYDLAGTREDSFVGLRMGRNSTSLRFETQYKPGDTTTGVSGNQGANLALTDGNWYRFRASFVRVNASTITVSGSIYNSDANGNVGTVVSSFGAVNLTVPDIAGDSQVWVALRGFATAGADAWDNLTVTAEGVSESLPAAPSGLTVTPLPGYGMRLAWTDNANNEDNFIVSRATSATGPFADIATLPFDTTSYTDNAAASPVRLFYQVRAVNSLGASNTSASAAVTFRSRYQWKNVAIGGGGYITGIFIHPLEPDVVYLRTDVGGFYRWNAATTSWIAITDQFTLTQSGYYGGEALALDPQNPNIVYLAGGTSLSFGIVLKSTDRGVTWTQLPLNSIQMHGNGSYRAAGERFVVSPYDSNLLIFGTRCQGLQRSTDGGATWAKMTSLPDSAWTSGDGIIAVLFDPLTAGVVYASAPGSGVWRSPDNGITWSLLANSPLDAQRLAIGNGGALLAAHGSGVSKYAGGTWTTTLPGGTAAGFRGISVNPANRDNVIVSDTSSAATGAKTYRSSDGGATWTQFSRPKVNTVPWLESFRLSNPALGSLEFDPAVPGRVWLSDWYGVWHCDNINAASPSFRNDMSGLEEVVTFTLAAPASGTLLLSGVADNDGFRHSNGLDSFPTARFSGQQETHSLAVYAGDPMRMARAAGGRTGPYHVFTSTNGGANWTTTNWNTAVPGSRALVLAIAASDPANIVAVTDSSLDATPRVTTDNGATWQAVTGLPNGPGSVFTTTLPLAADTVLADTFYYHDAGTGKLYRSTNKGFTFTQANAGAELPTTSSSIVLKSLPGVGGDLWVCLDTLGLYHSTNGGAAFTKIANVTRAYRFAFGKTAPGSTTPALYLYGSVSGYGLGVFRSLDLGQSWTEMTDPFEAMGDGPGVMEASAQEYGLVFIGTGGRGIFYGRPLPTVSVTADATPAGELGPVAANFTLSRDGDLTTALAVGFSLGGTATSGADFAAVGPSTTISSGASSALVTIAPVPDNLAEGDETVTLSLAPSANYLVGPDATLTIADKPFDAWRFAHGLGAVAADSDSDGDGLSNFLEYAVGSDPLAAQTPLYPSSSRIGSDLALTYQRLRESAEVEYRVEVSSDLVTWDYGQAFVQETLQPDGVTVLARDLAPAGSSSRFIRLRVLRLQ